MQPARRGADRPDRRQRHAFADQQVRVRPDQQVADHRHPVDGSAVAAGARPRTPSPPAARCPARPGTARRRACGSPAGCAGSEPARRRRCRAARTPAPGSRRRPARTGRARAARPCRPGQAAPAGRRQLPLVQQQQREGGRPGPGEQRDHLPAGGVADRPLLPAEPVAVAGRQGPASERTRSLPCARSEIAAAPSPPAPIRSATRARCRSVPQSQTGTAPRKVDPVADRDPQVPAGHAAEERERLGQRAQPAAGRLRDQVAGQAQPCSALYAAGSGSPRASVSTAVG